MKMLRKKLQKPAFTLLEILVTLCMLGLILGCIYGTYTATTRSLSHSKPRQILQQQARIFLQRITSEIRCCYAGHQALQDSPKDVPGTEKRFSKQDSVPLFIGREVSSGQTFLKFVTSAVSSRPEHSPGGLAVVEYMLDDSTNTLLRGERRYTGGFKDDNCNWLAVLENVQAVKIEYFNGEKWIDKWNRDDMKGLLPQAVRISLDLHAEGIGPVSFTSVARIACRGRQDRDSYDTKDMI